MSSATAQPASNAATVEKGWVYLEYEPWVQGSTEKVCEWTNLQPAKWCAPNRCRRNADSTDESDCSVRRSISENVGSSAAAASSTSSPTPHALGRETARTGARPKEA